MNKTVMTSSMTFVDLAGSERVLSKMGGNPRKPNDISAIEGLCTNWGLLHFKHVIVT